MNKILSSSILLFWCFAIIYMGEITIKYINSEPILTIVSSLGFFIFLASGIELVFPQFIESFVLQKDSEVKG
jgi:hypothetical protein